MKVLDFLFLHIGWWMGGEFNRKLAYIPVPLVSVVDPDSMGSPDPYLDPDSHLDPDSRSRSGSRRAKWPTNKEKLINFIFWSAGCSLLRAEGFSWSLDISKLQFLIKKDIKKFSVLCCSSVFGHQNPGSRLDPDQDSLETLNLDPQLCL